MDYPGCGTCGLTCAHVVLNPMEMKHLAPKRDNDMDLEFAPTGQTVYQPDSSQESYAVGKVVKAIYREGGGGESGIDIAVFHILQRYPFLGDFPDFKDGSRTPISYDSGKTADISRLGFSDVCKFGSMTDLTSGSVVMDAATLSVRTYEKYTVSNDYDVKLHNLIEIRPKTDISSFAEQGDSGALVFCEGENKQLLCVGVVEGGTSNNTCVIIPISPILEQLNLMSLKSFEINRIEQKIIHTGQSLNEQLNQNLRSTYNALDTRITESERTTDARITRSERTTNELIGRSEQAIERRMVQMEQNLHQLVQQESARTVTEVGNLLQNFMLQMSQSSQPKK